MILSDAPRTYMTIGLGVAGGILVLLWLAMILWALRDLRSRSRSVSASVLTVLLVAILPLVGLAVYLLLRPKLTLAEAYDRALEQEALLQQIEERPICPTCSRPTQPNWFLCPTCHTHLRQPCPTCNSALELHWDICPYCGYLFDEKDETIAEAIASEVMPDDQPQAEEVL